MPLPRSLAAYTDVERVLAAALAAGGARIKLANHRQAYRWRQRAYTFRKLLLEHDTQSPAVAVGARHASTPYDGMTIHLDPDESGEIELRFGGSPDVEAYDLDGKPLDLSQPAPQNEDTPDEETLTQAKRAILDLKTD